MLALLHHRLETATCIVSVILNMILLCTILYFSSQNVQVYKSVLLLSAVGDLLFSVVVLVVQPVGCPYHLLC